MKECIGCPVQKVKQGTKPGNESKTSMDRKSHQEHIGTNFLEPKWW